jgi:hypothetical protein
MKTYLRNLALTVGNADRDGRPHYFWALMESTGDATDFPKEVDAGSLHGYGTYGEALVAGYEAWRQLVGNNMVNGPRTGNDDAP